MMDRYCFTRILIVMILLFSGCSASNSDLMKSDAHQNQVNVIVLMPVENKTKDTRMQKLLSTRLLEELRFKGYSQVIIAANDVKSSFAKPGGEPGKTDLQFHEQIAGMQGADAAMYCTLRESQSSTTLFYSPATVSVHCELRNAKTGETIWNAEYRSTSRSFDVMNSKLKSNGSLESALEDVVGKVMETLPYGPMLRG